MQKFQVSENQNYIFGFYKAKKRVFAFGFFKVEIFAFGF